MQIGNIDRCRQLHKRNIELFPENSQAWINFANLETQLLEIERERSIYNLGVQQTILDKPDILWKSYIDFEIEREEHDRARELYKKLLLLSTDLRVWLSYSEFESSIGNIKESREIYDRAYIQLSSPQMSNERYLLLEKWIEFENKYGNEQTQMNVVKKMPEKIKKLKKITSNTGEDLGMEEYIEYIFPDNKQSNTNSLQKLIQRAKEWKQIEKETENEEDTKQQN